jgi:hypothetical protein
LLWQGYLALSKRLAGSTNWKATVTPLASIMGSGFLVSAPLLAGIVGNLAAVCMALLLVVAYMVGGAIRFNIRHFEPIRSKGHGPAQDIAFLSRIVLTGAYFISITYGVIILSVVAGLSLGSSATVYAQGVELGDGVVITAEVVAIDNVDRVLALLGPGGDVVEVEVSYEARNFYQIAVGDRVKVVYYESVALYMGKPGGKPEVDAGLVAARSAKGDKPAGVAVEAVDVSATVQKIHEKKRKVTLKLPSGKKVTTKVDKSVKAFDSLKVGDVIPVRYTEAIAISVEKP